MKTKKIICPVCKSSEIKILRPNEVNSRKISFTYKFSKETKKTFQVNRCKNCSHVFCYPLPKNIYKNYKDVVDKVYLKYSESRKQSSEEILKKLKKYKNSGRILDIGCATGDFLLVAKEAGYKVEGLELSKWSSKLAEKKGIKVYRDTLKILSKKYPHRYDLITMWGVIEHFEYPSSELIYINKLLKKNGMLALWTGDVDSFTSKLLGKNWWYWQGQHIQYFTYKSMNVLAKQSGFKHLNTYLYPQAMNVNQLNDSLRRYALRNLILVFIKPFFLIKPIWYFRIPGEMFWIGKKIK